MKVSANEPSVTDIEDVKIGGSGESRTLKVAYNEKGGAGSLDIVIYASNGNVLSVIHCGAGAVSVNGRKKIGAC